MKGIIQFWRLMTIQYILVKHGIDRVVLTVPGLEHLQFLSYLNPWNWFRNRTRSDAESIRLALEALGPIFVKFGQLLSTRPDIIPDDIIAELSKLQDQVPAFPGEIAQKIVEKSCGKPITEIFSEFELTPLASASISQVHAAKLKTGESVVVKILRPDILKLIKHDVALMYFVARMTMRFWSEGYRLRPVEVVAEFEQTIMDELDLMREASNASQLRRNFTGSSLLVVPKVYWDYCRGDILVLERIDGIPVSDVKQLKKKKYDLKKLAETGVEIFFTQVFRDSFFHADMHPGNIFISRHNPESPHYIAVDFGIMGTLSPLDQRYIAENLLAFFRRDYRQVAILHVESGWVPAETRIDAFESAIRCVCEPIFERPLKEISFGKLLLRLFQTAGRFNMTVQPQLLLLQKTLLNIEGLGRQLYPDLDLWSTALPFLERWMQQRIGVKALARNVVDRAPGWAEKLTDMPDLVYRAIQEHLQILRLSPKSNAPKEIVQKSPLKRLFFGSGVAFIAASAISLWFADSQLELRTAASWFISGFGILLIFVSAMMGRKSI